MPRYIVDTIEQVHSTYSVLADGPEEAALQVEADHGTETPDSTEAVEIIRVDSVERLPS